MSHKDQGDCRGGNKTGGLVHSSAAYIYMNETIERIQTQWMCLGHYFNRTQTGSDPLHPQHREDAWGIVLTVPCHRHSLKCSRLCPEHPGQSRLCLGRSRLSRHCPEHPRLSNNTPPCQCNATGVYTNPNPSILTHFFSLK